MNSTLTHLMHNKITITTVQSLPKLIFHNIRIVAYDIGIQMYMFIS